MGASEQSKVRLNPSVCNDCPSVGVQYLLPYSCEWLVISIWPGCVVKQLMWFWAWWSGSTPGWFSSLSATVINHPENKTWQPNTLIVNYKITHLRHTVSQWYDLGNFQTAGTVWEFWQITNCWYSVSPSSRANAYMFRSYLRSLAAPAEHKMNLGQMQYGAEGSKEG